jgi:hypothetical protein
MIPKEWILKAIDLEDGKEIWVPCTSKKEQTRIINELEADKKAIQGYFPVQAGQIAISRLRKGNDLFVKMYKEPSGNPLYVWERETFEQNGEKYTKQDMIRLTIDPVQLRRLLQMKEDGLGLSDMAKYENIPVEHISVLLEYALTGNKKKNPVGRPRKY